MGNREHHAPLVFALAELLHRKSIFANDFLYFQGIHGAAAFAPQFFQDCFYPPVVAFCNFFAGRVLRADR